VTEAIAAFNDLRSPTPDHARAVLSAILEGCESLLDALLACRLVEGSLELATHHARNEDERASLTRDIEGLISMLAGRLSLGALNTVLKADSLGQKRALVRAYRMELIAHHPTANQPQTAHRPSNLPKDHTVAAPWQQWLRKPRALPRRNGPLALGASAMVIALPIAGAVAAPAGTDGIPLWSAIAGLMAASAAVAVLCSPFRWPAQRGDTANPSAAQPQHATADSAPAEVPPSLAHHQSALRAQGLNVGAMSELDLAHWIEESGREIAKLLETARNQSLAANIADDDAD
jgi:hypothetical protein